MITATICLTVYSLLKWKFLPICTGTLHSITQTIGAKIDLCSFAGIARPKRSLGEIVDLGFYLELSELFKFKKYHNYKTQKIQVTD